MVMSHIAPWGAVVVFSLRKPCFMSAVPLWCISGMVDSRKSGSSLESGLDASGIIKVYPRHEDFHCWTT